MGVAVAYLTVQDKYVIGFSHINVTMASGGGEITEYES